MIGRRARLGSFLCHNCTPQPFTVERIIPTLASLSMCPLLSAGANEQVPVHSLIYSSHQGRDARTGMAFGPKDSTGIEEVSWLGAVT